MATSMTDAQLDAHLDEQRVLRLATLDEDGWPAVVPVWFVWHDGAFWVWNLVRAARTARLRAGTRCSFVVDGGDAYAELRGATGRLDVAEVAEDDVPDEVRMGFSRRYGDGIHPVEPADHHTWFRFVPRGTVRSWDFRRLAG